MYIDDNNNNNMEKGKVLLLLFIMIIITIIIAFAEFLLVHGDVRGLAVKLLCVICDLRSDLGCWQSLL